MPYKKKVKIDCEKEECVSLQAVYVNPRFPKFGTPRDTRLQTNDGTEFEVHRDLLSSKSEFFKALFSWNEEDQIKVIHGIEPNILELILVYLYTDRISLRNKNMLQLLVASDFLLIEPLIGECGRFILRKKTVKNIVSLYLTANRIKRVDIEHGCRRFLLRCFEKALEHSSAEAYDLPYESLEYFLSNRSINVSGERFIWSFIEAWVQKDPPNRLIVVPELLRCISMNEVDEELASDITSSSIIRKNKLYEDLGDPHGILPNLDRAQRVINHCRGVSLVNGARLPPSLCVFTKGSLRRRQVQMYLSYDDELDLGRKLCDVPYRPLKLLSAGHRVYILDNNNYSALTYDLLKNEEKPMVLLPLIPTSYESSIYVEVSESIYVLEKFSLDHSRRIHEYDDERNEWIERNPMQYSLILEEVLTMNGLIYVIGTLEDLRDVLVQVYDPSLDTWETVSSPNIPRVFCKAVAYQNKMFLMGGRIEDFEDLEYEDDVSRVVEVYDPVEDEWVVYPQLPLRYIGKPMAEVVKGRLYVYDYEKPSSVSCWDGSGKWKVLSDHSPLKHKYLNCFCTVEDVDVVRELMRENKAIDATCWVETGFEKEM